MKIWTNTNTLEGYDAGLNFTALKNEAQIVLMGSKSINISDFPNINAIFRAGVGSDNVPTKDAEARNIVVRFPSSETINIIFEETANFTCNSILKMSYLNTGSIVPWNKESRPPLSEKVLLVLGKGNIGNRVIKKMENFMKVISFDILENNMSDLKALIQSSDCISLHIPYSNENKNFIGEKELSWFKDGAILINTARGKLVDEDALYNEIRKGRLKAAFDVYWEEPYSGKLNEFHPNSFFMTPHIASTCDAFLKGCRNDLDKLIQELPNE